MKLFFLLRSNRLGEPSSDDPLKRNENCNQLQSKVQEPTIQALQVGVLFNKQRSFSVLVLLNILVRLYMPFSVSMHILKCPSVIGCPSSAASRRRAIMAVRLPHLAM